MKSWNKLIAIRGEEGDEDCLKEGEGISQRTYRRTHEHRQWCEE